MKGRARSRTMIPPPTKRWCSHCKKDTHDDKYCYVLHPEKIPTQYKKRENAGGEDKSQASGATSATANQENKSADASKGSGEKKQSGTPSKDGKSNGKGRGPFL